MNRSRSLGFGASAVLHAAAIVAIVWSPSRPAPPSPASATPDPPAAVVADAGSADVPAPVIPVPRGGAASPLRIGAFRFDYRKIAERPTTLFPFLTQALPLERTVSVRPRTGGSLMQPSAPAAARRTSRRLVLSDTALQQLVDKAWSRRERWKPFGPIAALVTAHGPDDERLLALLRAYRDQNLLQPYVDATNHDPLVWVMLGIAADHGDFLDFVGKYAARHPSSKVTTELLFLLDELAQGSFDALCLLLDTRGHDLWWTRESDPAAYELFVTIQRHYRVQLRIRNLPREGLGAYYDNVRLRLLDYIVRTTPEGYRINDALFLSGGIYWNQGRKAEALRAWREMMADPEDVYAKASSEVRAALQATISEDGRDVDSAAIDRILGAEGARWTASSVRRLAHFGHSVDTF
jgi:hypothetical protein